MKNLWFS